MFIIQLSGILATDFHCIGASYHSSRSSHIISTRIEIYWLMSVHLFIWQEAVYLERLCTVSWSLLQN